MMKQYTEKRLLELLPEVQPIIKSLLQLGYDNGLNVQISCGYRSPEAQDELYKIGRSKPGRIVTNARGGFSEHEKRIAIDLFFLNTQNEATFNIPDYRKLWNLAVKNGLDKQGLTWSGTWVGFKEMCHFSVKL
jgi:peptidoglycan LD-endopeptidase CwlK